MNTDIQKTFLRLLQPIVVDDEKEAVDALINTVEQYEKMRSVLRKIVDSFPELDDEDEPLNGSDAVDVLCELWPEIKAAIQSPQ